MKTNIKPFELPEDIRQELRDMIKHLKYIHIQQ